MFDVVQLHVFPLDSSYDGHFADADGRFVQIFLTTQSAVLFLSLENGMAKSSSITEPWQWRASGEVSHNMKNYVCYDTSFCDLALTQGRPYSSPRFSVH